MGERICWRLMTALALLASSPCTGPAADGQVHGKQGFRVRVGPRVTVSAPPAGLTSAREDGRPDTPLAAQRWSVDTNCQSGVTVSFSTRGAFTNTQRPERKRDAELDLTLPEGEDEAEWTVLVGSDRTRHALGGAAERATVRAVSAGPGRGTLDVTVTFLANPNDPFESGEYALTLVGTVTTN
jgi:hypothetical protein